MSINTNNQQQQQQQLPQIYTLEQMESILESDRFAVELVEAVEAGFVAYSRGDFCAAPIQTLGAPPLAPFSIATRSSSSTTGNTDPTNYAAQTCVKSGYIVGDDVFCIKVASGGHPLPNNSGLLQVYSQTTGRLETLLLDEGLLTEHRTAAAGAVAAKHCWIRNHNNNTGGDDRITVNKIGILGTGVQARFQLRYLKQVVSENCRDVLVWGRTWEHAVQFQTDLQEQGWGVELAAQPSDLWNDCDLIVTTTSAREPILSAPVGSTTGDDKEQQQPRRRRHITCIGADAPGKMELSVDLVAKADLWVADSRLQTVERGEFQSAIAQGLIDRDLVVELGELIIDDKKAGRVPKDGLSIFDSSGVAVQDCVAAKLMSRFLRESEVKNT